LVELELGSGDVTLLALVVGGLEEVGLQAQAGKPRAGVTFEVGGIGSGAHGSRDPVPDAEKNEQDATHEQHVLVRGQASSRDHGGSVRLADATAKRGGGDIPEL
jgi:hypothetical protein